MMPMIDKRPRSAMMQLLGRVGQDRQREAHEAVGAHLQQDGGEDDRAGGRRLDVRVGQPGVEREHRHLDGEAEEEAEEDPELQRAAGSGVRCRGTAGRENVDGLPRPLMLRNGMPPSLKK